MTGLLSAFELVRTFKGQSLANRIAFLERDAENKSRKELPALLAESAISSALMRSAIEVKRAASQIDEVVHAVGTLLALPDILEEGETIESLSPARVTLDALSTWKPTEGSRSSRLSTGREDQNRFENKSYSRISIVSRRVNQQAPFGLCFGRRPCAAGVHYSFLLQEYAAEIRRSAGRIGGEIWAEMTVREYYGTKKHVVAIVNLKLVSPTVAHAFESVAATA